MAGGLIIFLGVVGKVVVEEVGEFPSVGEEEDDDVKVGEE